MERGGGLWIHKNAATDSMQAENLQRHNIQKTWKRARNLEMAQNTTQTQRTRWGIGMRERDCAQLYDDWITFAWLGFETIKAVNETGY